MQKNYLINSTPIHVYNSLRIRIRGELLQLDNEPVQKPCTAANSERLNAFPYDCEQGAGCHCPYHIVGRFTQCSNRARRQIKGIQVLREENKTVPFTEDMIANTEYLKKTYKEIPRPSKFSKVTGWKINFKISLSICLQLTHEH